jgi:hypothetical protein
MDKTVPSDNNGGMARFGAKDRILRIHAAHPQVGVSRFAEYDRFEPTAFAPIQVDIVATSADKHIANNLIARLLSFNSDYFEPSWSLQTHIDRGPRNDVPLDESDCILILGGSEPFSPTFLAKFENHARRGGAIVAVNVGGPNSPEWREFARKTLAVELENATPAPESMILRIADGRYFHPLVHEVSAWEVESLRGVMLDSQAKPYLEGICGTERQPLAWGVDTGRNRNFATLLGTPSDFQQRSFYRLIWNALQWTLGTT